LTVKQMVVISFLADDPAFGKNDDDPIGHRQQS
jgi:hypothetical protein